MVEGGMNGIRTTEKRRRGATVVETAVMAPLVVAAMLGMVELGYSFMVRQTVTNASREGARAGCMPGATSADVEAAVNATMSGAGLSGYTSLNNVDDLSPEDNEVWVEVSLPLSRAMFTGNIFGGGTFDITARSTMRRERTGVNNAEDDD
jgi:hypothetical protein